MSHSILIEQLQQCASKSDTYLINLIRGRNTEQASDSLCKKALDSFPLECKTGSFVETEDALNEIGDEAAEALTSGEVPTILDSMVKYNLVVLANNLKKGLHLEECDAFFKEELSRAGVNSRQKLRKEELVDFLKEVYHATAPLTKRSLEQEASPQQPQQQQKRPRRLIDEQENAQVLGEEVVSLSDNDDADDFACGDEPSAEKEEDELANDGENEDDDGEYAPKRRPKKTSASGSKFLADQRRETKRGPKAPPAPRKKPEPWTSDETFALEQGLKRLKRPDWTQIIIDSEGALINRSNVNCKDKARTELNKLARQGLTEKEDLGAWGYVKFPEY